MRWLAIAVGGLLILGHYQLETSEILQKKFKRMETMYINPFIRKSYIFPSPEGTPRGKISLLWWIKYVCDDFLWILTFFVSALAAYFYSFRLFRIFCLYFLYHCFDHFMLWYDYRTTHWTYHALNIVSFFCIVVMFLPDKKQGLVKSMR